MPRLPKACIFACFYTQVLLQAFDYKFSGIAESYSKVGFNHSKINSKEGIFPTETYSTITAKLQIDVNLLSKKIENHSVKMGLGGMLGAFAYDSTKTLIDQSNGKVYGTMLWFYLGRWWGFLGDAPWKKSHFLSNMHARDYVLYNAYLSYSYDNKFQLKLGRYLSKMHLMSGYTQGFELDYKITPKISFKWFSSFGRALAFGAYIRDFYAPITYDNKDKIAFYGIHSLNLKISTKYFSTTPFFYFSPKIYNAPGLETHIDSNPKFKGLGFRSLTQVVIFFPIYASYLANEYWRNAKIGHFGTSLSLHQRFDYNEYNFGFGYYENFGNANAKIGWYGSSTPILFRDNSIYDGFLDNLISPNAITGYVFCGGVHKKFLWGILGKYTYAPRASERALGLHIGYKYNQFFSVDILLQYHHLNTHKGYKTNISDWYQGYNKNFKATSQDRSALYVSMKFSF
ncbi:outer membrane family protein [Helicobacter cetorum]|uniref:outer membrane family protein n=1 Tax=Helicobacter cetorum TaxID=138563 RepID=UPI000CF112AD|nr:outer membrane family protein [Helicobacter cetorum]